MLDFFLEALALNSFFYALIFGYLQVPGPLPHILFVVSTISLSFGGYFRERVAFLRFLPLTGLLLFALMSDPSLQVFLVVLVIADLMYLQVIGRFDADAFAPLVIGAIVLVVLSNGFNLADTTGSAFRGQFSVYVALFLLSVFLFLRAARYRQHRESQRAVMKENIPWFLLMGVIFLVGSIPFLQKNFLGLLLRLAALVTGAISFVSAKLVAFIFSGTYQVPTEVAQTSEASAPAASAEASANADLVAQTLTTINFQSIVSAFMAVFFMAVAFIFLRKTVNSIRQRKSYSEEGTELREELQLIETPKKGLFSRLSRLPSDKAAQARWIFREYLRPIRNKAETDTSTDLVRKGEAVYHEVPQTLLSLYQRNRYGEKELSDEELEAMKTELQRLKRQK